MRVESELCESTLDTKLAVIILQEGYHMIPLDHLPVYILWDQENTVNE